MLWPTGRMESPFRVWLVLGPDHVSTEDQVLTDPCVLFCNPRWVPHVAELGFPPAEVPIWIKW